MTDEDNDPVEALYARSVTDGLPLVPPPWSFPNAPTRLVFKPIVPANPAGRARGRA